MSIGKALVQISKTLNILEMYGIVGEVRIPLFVSVLTSRNGSARHIFEFFHRRKEYVMAQIKAQTETMQQKARDFETSVQNLGDTLSQVKSSIEQLQGAWSSSAADSFSNVMIQWNKDVQQLKDTLEEVAKNVNVAGVSYQDLDNDIKKSFGG